MNDTYKINNNTPTRNWKVGLPDPQGNNEQVGVATTGPSKMVQDMAAQNFALKNGGQTPPMQGNGTGTPPPVATVNPNLGTSFNNRVIGRFDLPKQNGTGPTVDFTNMQKPADFVPQGNGFANPTVGPVSSPYMKDAADTTPQNITNFENMPQAPTGWNPDGTPKYDSLSAALNGTSVLPQQPQQAQFQSDPSKKDGGFFNWIKGLVPKKRPGKREGETDDEYDARRTRNMRMVATFADAIRHMGNIVNTSKGAPLQVFNDPTTMLEQGRQQRKAERQKKAAADADMAYKQANMTLKERAAEADRLYKQLTLGYKDAAGKRAQRQFEYQVAKDAAAAQRQAEQDKQKQDNWEKNFNAKQQQNAISNGLRQQSINKRGSGRSGKGGSGSGGKYWFEDKNGKMHYQPNKTMWEQEFYREYGYLPNETSSSTSTKTYDKNGNEVTTTTRKKGTAMTSEAAKKQNDAKAARQKAEAAKKAGSGKSAGKSKNGYKNTKALGL